jgi:uncharacterized protein
MLVSVAEVKTDRASRYLTQLCKHFAHKVRAEWTDRQGRVEFDFGACTLVAQDAFLELTAAAPDSEALARVEHVVGSHAERFGSRDGLTVTWQRRGSADSSAPVSLS